MLTALAATLLIHAAPATLTVGLKPAACVLFVDGKKKGTGEKPLVLKLTAGKHLLRVVYKGDAHEEEIVLKAGSSSPWNWEFTGVEEDPPKE